MKAGVSWCRRVIVIEGRTHGLIDFFVAAADFERVRCNSSAEVADGGSSLDDHGERHIERKDRDKGRGGNRP